MLLRFSILSIVILLTSCSTAHVKATWTDTEIVEKIDSVLVVGVAIRKNRRHLFETTLAKKISKYGVRAIPSYTVFPKEEMSQEAT